MTSVQREAGQEPGLTEKASSSVQDAASTAQEKVGELKELLGNDDRPHILSINGMFPHEGTNGQPSST